MAYRADAGIGAISRTAFWIAAAIMAWLYQIADPPIR